MRLALLALIATLAASAPAAQPSGGGILVVSPAPRLAIDAGLGERTEPAAWPADVGPRERGAWRGAKAGALTGLAVGAVGTAVAFFFADRARVSSDTWPVVAGASVPLTVLATGVGAAIGAVRARPDAVPPPVPVAP